MKENTKNIIMDSIKNKPMDPVSIAKEVNMNLKDITNALDDLENEYKVKITKKGKYILSNYKIGKINIIRSGAGFVKFSSTDKDLYIREDNLKNALNGDEVVAEIIKDTKNEGRIIKVISREKEYEIGEVIVHKDRTYIKLDDIKKSDVFIEVNNNKSSLITGHKVSVKIGDWIKENIYEGEIVKVIGHINDPGMDITSIVASHNISIEFPQSVLEEVDKLPTEVRDIDFKNRVDLRDQTIITIDGDDAKDLDDAISIDMLDNGNYLLGVHISDVSYYVKKGSEIDKEAYSRGTSCYLADRVIPELPHKLSNGICSLNEGIDRLTKTCQMEIDSKGNLVKYDIFDSVINSKKRMTYNKVQDILENTSTDTSYEPYIEDLKTMEALSNILCKKREKNGCVDFDTTEMKIIVDNEGRAIDILKKVRFESEKIIESFMIEANVTVATHIHFLGLPFVYRVHDEPNVEKLNEFVTFVKLMSEKIGSLPENMHPKAIQQILDSLKDSPQYEIYSNLLLRCMKKAVYSIENIGHFGLSLDNYTHFTAPIRRYPDLLVHRMLSDYKSKNYCVDDKYIEKSSKYLTEATAHSSRKEQKAILCEREVNKMKSAEFMEKHTNELFIGKIVSVTDFGFYVDIYNGVEGLVKLSDLNKGYYDKDTYTIFTGDYNQYRIGDLVEVMVDSSIKELGQINLSVPKKLENNRTLRKTWNR